MGPGCERSARTESLEGREPMSDLNGAVLAMGLEADEIDDYIPEEFFTFMLIEKSRSRRETKSKISRREHAEQR